MVACGHSRVAGGLHVGLLFVAARVKQPSLTLASAQERITVSLPREYLDLPAPKWAASVTLEVT